VNEATREYIRRLVDDAPPLSQSQRDLIRRICVATLTPVQPAAPVTEKRAS
jgi:hypothetical protein